MHIYSHTIYRRTISSLPPALCGTRGLCPLFSSIYCLRVVSSVRKKPLTTSVDNLLCCLAATQTKNPYLSQPVLQMSSPHPKLFGQFGQLTALLHAQPLHPLSLSQPSFQTHISRHCILPVLSVQRL